MTRLTWAHNYATRKVGRVPGNHPKERRGLWTMFNIDCSQTMHHCRLFYIRRENFFQHKPGRKVGCSIYKVIWKARFNYAITRKDNLQNLQYPSLWYMGSFCECVTMGWGESLNYPMVQKVHVHTSFLERHTEHKLYTNYMAVTWFSSQMKSRSAKAKFTLSLKRQLIM